MQSLLHMRKHLSTTDRRRSRNLDNTMNHVYVLWVSKRQLEIAQENPQRGGSIQMSVHCVFFSVSVSACLIGCIKKNKKWKEFLSVRPTDGFCLSVCPFVRPSIRLSAVIFIQFFVSHIFLLVIVAIIYFLFQM